LIKNFNDKIFFQVFKKKIIFPSCIKIDYGGIEKKWGIWYEFKINEIHFLKNPDEIKFKKIKNNKMLYKKNYLIPKFLPTELQIIIFEYLDYKTLCSISNVCYYWYKLSLNNRFWKKILENEYKLDINFDTKKYKNGNIKKFFEKYYLSPSMINRKRIINCISQINLIYSKWEKYIDRKSIVRN
jgi:hypothetical protein